MPCIPASSPSSIQHHHHHHRVLGSVGAGMGCGAEAAVAAATTTGMMCGAHHGEVPAEVARHHEHAEPGSGQCCSAVVQHVAAPAAAVWQFDQPQAYKRFVRSCALVAGDGGVGTLREVHVVSGLPAASSRERLEILDDESHVLSFRVVGGEHRLKNYLSVTTVHPSPPRHPAPPSSWSPTSWTCRRATPSRTPACSSTPSSSATSSRWPRPPRSSPPRREASSASTLDVIDRFLFFSGGMDGCVSLRRVSISFPSGVVIFSHLSDPSFLLFLSLL